MADWIKRENSKAKIDQVGQTLASWWDGGSPQLGLDETQHAFDVVQNWRSSHAMPLLTVRMNLEKRAKAIDPKVLVAQRIKRIQSTLNKLVREPTMKLSQMHDLGGCRAIVSNVEAIRTLTDIYAKRSLISQKEMRCYDYLNAPKLDGYRGVHLVVRYVARKKSNEPWNGQRVEIQLRTRLQHAFSTAVETVSLFTRSALKTGGGATEWRRFFSLMGSALAHREGTPPVPGTPFDYAQLVSELRAAAGALNVEARLMGWTTALKVLSTPNRPQASKSNRWMLLTLDLPARTIKVTAYSNRKEAAEKLAVLEKGDNGKNLDVVLVWVDHVKDLRKAFPNYYGDTTEFVKLLGSILGTKAK